jgi:hypothetical protein
LTEAGESVPVFIHVLYELFSEQMSIFFLSAIKIEVLYYFHSKDPANFVGSFG